MRPGETPAEWDKRRRAMTPAEREAYRDELYQRQNAKERKREKEDLTRQQTRQSDCKAYWYTGSQERGNFQRLSAGNPRIQTLNDLFDVLYKAGWQANTAYPDAKKDWSPADPAYGQCAITAMLVCDLFGGYVRKCEYHYFNEIDGVIVDLTGAQGGGIPQFLYDESRRRARNLIGRSGDTKRRYDRMVENVRRYLESLDKGTEFKPVETRQRKTPTKKTAKKVTPKKQ